MVDPAIAITCPPLNEVSEWAGSLDTDIACEHTDFTTLIHAKGDLTVVHVFKFPIQRNRFSRDAGDESFLCLAGIEIR